MGKRSFREGEGLGIVVIVPLRVIVGWILTGLAVGSVPCVVRRNRSHRRHPVRQDCPQFREEMVDLRDCAEEMVGESLGDHCRKRACLSEGDVTVIGIDEGVSGGQPAAIEVVEEAVRLVELVRGHGHQWK